MSNDMERSRKVQPNATSQHSARRHLKPQRRFRFFAWPTRVLLIVLIVVGVFAYFNRETRAAPGDYAVYREATGLESVTTTATNQAWDTTVSAASMFSIDVGRTTVTLSEVGHYLALYNLGVEYVSGTGRVETQGYLNLNGTNSAYGRASCLVLNLGGASQCVMSGGAIINTAAITDNVKMVGQRTDTSAATARRMANTSALTLVRLDDDWAYARVREVGGGQAFNVATWATLSIDTSDELDAGFSRTDGDITLASAGRYLVTTNVHFVSTRAGRERLQATRLTLNGFELPGTRVTGLVTGDNSDFDAVASYVGVIEATTTNQVLRLQGACLGVECGNVTNAPNGTAITIVRLPDTVETVQLTETTGGQLVDATNDPILWDTQVRVDSAGFSHSTTTSTSRVNVEANDDYLFLGSFYTDRTTPNTTILNPYWQLRTNGTTKLTYGSFDAVNPGTSGTRAANRSGASGGSIFPSLTAGDYVEFVNTDTTTGVTANPYFAGTLMGMQGIRLSTLNQPDITVYARGTQQATVSVPTTNFYLGGSFSFQANHSFPTETITSVTVTETGTVDAQNDLSNIRLYYEFDTSDPYDCASETYAGTELQYGATSSAFSSANGSTTFSGSVVASTTQAVCMYVVLDVDTTANDGDTIDVEITSPSTEVVLGGGPVGPNAAVALSGSTLIQDDNLTQIHYHWRNDDGTETGATSATGGTEDTVLVNLSVGDPKRIRLEISNEGSVSSAPTQFRLEYATRTDSCVASTGWTDVAASSGAWDMFDSPNLTEGSNTTNISVATGGVTDENTTFLTPNGGVRDTTSQTGSLTATSGNFIELEYSVVATANAVSGTSYCFRVTNAGVELPSYIAYPEVSIAASVLVSAVDPQATSVDASTTDFYIGGAWAVQDQAGSRNVTSITLSEVGTVDAQNDLSNIRLYYEFDTSDPYDCTSETYSGTEQQYGATSTAFSGADGSATFTQTVGISTTQALCLYAVLDVGPDAANGETIDIEITNPGAQVVVSAGSVNPNNPVGPSGATTIAKPILEQAHYHWRNNDGTEVGATSATGGVEDTNITNVQRTETQRLRLLVDNTGSTSSAPTTFTLEYVERSGSCAASMGWESVGGAGASWVMSETANLTDGSNTINIANVSGGVTDPPGSTFLTPNSGIRDTQATTGPLVLSSTNFVEFEFAIEATSFASFGTTYCFRLTGTGTQVSSYPLYPQATIRQNQDFYIQRNAATIPNGNTSVSLVAGVDYVTPATSSRAFIRITNTLSTGAGSSGGGGTQNASNVTVYIANPGNIMSGITFTRTGNTGDTRVYWEIVEYTGPAGGDNEMLVRSTQVATFASKSLTANVSVINVVDDTQAVVFITGQRNPQTNATDYDTGIATAQWNGVANQAEFTRGRFVGGPGNTADASFAVVEFTGANWRVQRTEHTYTAVGAVETETIASVNDISRAFIHAQHRTNQSTVANLGHLVWLSGVGQVSFQIPGEATSPGTHVSVAWVIENTQTNGFPMEVTRSAGVQAADVTEPLTYSIPIGTTVSGLSQASIFATLVSSGTDQSHPRAIAGATIASTTHYELWLSDTGANRMYRTEVVEWPTAVLTVKQNYYRFYVDNNALDPTDPWPLGGTDLGENTSITGYDDPLSSGERVRIRMSLNILGANISAGSKQFALEYGVRTSSCTAISSWYPVGDAGSTTAVWRGYNAAPLDGTALSGNPPTVGDLNLSVSDRAGTYEEGSPTAVNPYKIFIGDDVEYDWILEANSITELTTYCFRMVLDGGSELDGYTYYPTLRSAGFALEQRLWRWYDDETSLTPSSALAATNTAPSNIAQDNALKLRVTLGEYAGSNGNNLKLKLQWSESSDFAVAYDVADFNHCIDNSRWCYYDGAGDDNATITSAVLPDSDTCTGGTGPGCGTHNEYPYTIKYIGEVGTTSTDYLGTTVTLQNTYTDPIVIAEAITGDATGGSANRPAVAVITATSSSSFTVRIQEPDNETDTHGTEEVAYIVMERGAHILPDGTRVDVNSTTTDFYYGNAAAGSNDGVCTFTQTFTHTPAVYTALQSDNNTGSSDFFTASQLLVTPTNFACSIEVPDDSTLAPTNPETYGWIALSPGAFNNNGIRIEATTTSTSITGWTDTPWYEQAFFTEFLNTPGIVASKQTRIGADGGWVRYDNADLDSVQLAIDELATPERAHPSESVAYLAFSEKGVIYDDDGVSDFVFTANTTREFEFTIRHADAKPNVTYFFRAYDVNNAMPIDPVPASSYPSLSTQSASLTSTTAGITSGSTVDGISIDVTSTPTTIPFGTLPLGTPLNAAQRISITTNATEGYQLLMYENQDLMSSNGGIIQDITGSNAAPVAWSTGCSQSAPSCFGYHVGDNTLAGGSGRFLITDTFAPLTSSLEEVGYSSGPVTAEPNDIVFRIKATGEQPAGTYENRIIYIIVPVF